MQFVIGTVSDLRTRGVFFKGLLQFKSSQEPYDVHALWHVSYEYSTHQFHILCHRGMCGLARRGSNTHKYSIHSISYLVTEACVIYTRAVPMSIWLFFKVVTQGTQLIKETYVIYAQPASFHLLGIQPNFDFNCNFINPQLITKACVIYAQAASTMNIWLNFKSICRL